MGNHDWYPTLDVLMGASTRKSSETGIKSHLTTHKTSTNDGCSYVFVCFHGCSSQKNIWYLKFQCISSVFIHPKMHLLPFSPRGGCANFRWRTTDLFSGRKTDWKWIKSKWIRLEIAQWSHKRHVIFSLKASTSASQKKPGKMKPEMYPKSENSEMCNLITLQESEKKMYLELVWKHLKSSQSTSDLHLRAFGLTDLWLGANRNCEIYYFAIHYMPIWRFPKSWGYPQFSSILFSAFPL